jgi:hypothetical protein
VPSGAVHNFYVNGASIITIASGGLVSTGPIGGTVINEAGQALSARYLSLGGGSLTGALTVNGNINITSSGTNKLIFDNVLNGKKIEIATNNFIGVDTNGMILSTSGQFRVAKGTNLIGCTWVPLGLEVVSWLRRNIPMSSVDLAGLLLPRHLRRCCLAAGGKHCRV